MGVLTTNDFDGEHELAKDFHFPTSRNVLIIFTRNAEPGKCKTRLAKTIGNEKALELYKKLLNHTAEITQNLRADKFVFYTECIIQDDLWNPEQYSKRLQQGADLGDRMEAAFREVFDLGYEKAIIIGSDMYDLKQQDLETAFEAMQTRDVVIGPAQDGGYYLLGLKKLVPQLFTNKVWGSDSVLKDTLQILEKETVFELPLRNDIDVYDDLKQHPELHSFLIEKHYQQ